MAETRATSRGLTDAQHAQLERWLFDFEEHWSPRALRKHVRNVPFEDAPSQRAALIELVKIDLEKQWASGQRIRLEAYLKETDQLGDVQTVSPDLILAEYQARLNAGETPDLSRFAARFPQQLDRFQKLIAECTFTAAPAKPPQSERPTQSYAGSTLLVHPDQMQQQVIPDKLGRYVIRRFLAKGGMGAVYKGYDPTLERHVAIKVPHADVVDNPAALERFYREAKAVAALDHPNICSVFEVAEEDGIHFLAMAYIRGEDLRRYIERNQPLDQQQIASAMYKLARAMQAAHEKGVLHRDLKPSNIRVARSGELKIMDFGLAKRLDRQQPSDTQAGQMLGTPMYMAPEQAEGRIDAIGPATDIYGLGAVMYQMLTGQPPFSGKSIHHIVSSVIDGAVTPPSQVHDGVDNRLEEICLKSMAQGIADRYAAMSDFAAALQEYLLQKSAPPPPEPPPFVEESHHTSDAAASYDEEIRELETAETSNRSTRRVTQSRPRRSWPPMMYLGLAAASIVIAIGIVVYVKTDTGTLKLEVQDSIIRIVIDDQQIELDATSTERSLRAGEHSLRVQVSDNSVLVGSKLSIAVDGKSRTLTIPFGVHELNGERFEIRRGQTVSVVISIEGPVATDIDTSKQVVELPKDFSLQQGTKGIFYEAFADSRNKPTLWTSRLTIQESYRGRHGGVHFMGPAYRHPEFGPYILHDAQRNLLLLHPRGKSGMAAGISVEIPADGEYDVQVDFARANNFLNHGDGVVVQVVKNSETRTPLYQSRIGSKQDVEVNDVFSGEGVAHFETTESFDKSDLLRFLVFAGDVGAQDSGFDITALRLSIQKSD